MVDLIYSLTNAIIVVIENTFTTVWFSFLLNPYLLDPTGSKVFLKPSHQTTRHRPPDHATQATRPRDTGNMDLGNVPLQTSKPYIKKNHCYDLHEM